MKSIFTALFLFTFVTAVMSQTKLSGKITDKEKQPLPGANIYLKDTYDGISSESDGSFSFTTDEEGEGILVVSFVGYKTHSQNVKLDGMSKFIEIVRGGINRAWYGSYFCGFV